MKLIKILLKWIHCGNDCEHCPAGWEESSYTDCGTEYDGGCYIYGDEWPEPCRLMLPKFLRAFLARRNKYLDYHQWDDSGDWFEKQEAGREKIKEAVEKELEHFNICWKGTDGTCHPYDRDSIISEIVWRSKSAYDDFIRPPRKSIRQKWAELIKETVSIPMAVIKSYVCK